MATVQNAINNTVGGANSGATNTFTVTNPSNTASSAATEKITVGGATAGDAWTQWSVGTAQSYALGVDNSDSDKLKITSAASGTIDPSSGTLVAGFTAAGGTEFGPDSNGGSSASIIGYFAKNQAATTDVRVSNTNAAGQAQLATIADTGTTLMATTGSTAAEPNIGVFSSSAGEVSLKAANAGGTTVMTFKGGALGATLWGSVSAAGAWTRPLQPAFLAYLSATAENKTGNGTAYTLGTDALTEVFDRGSNFNTNGTFTAPITGIYDLKAQVTITGATIATTFVISIVTTARTYTKTFIKAAGSQDESVEVSALCDMAATNTATVTITVTGEGADTDDIKGGAALETFFCGTLVA